MGVLLLIASLFLTILAFAMQAYQPEMAYHHLLWAFAGGTGLTASIKALSDE